MRPQEAAGRDAERSTPPVGPELGRGPVRQSPAVEESGPVRRVVLPPAAAASAPQAPMVAAYEAPAARFGAAEPQPAEARPVLPPYQPPTPARPAAVDPSAAAAPRIGQPDARISAWQPSVQPSGQPFAGRPATGPAQPSFGQVSAPTFDPVGIDTPGRGVGPVPSAFVPVGTAPAMGQPFGTVHPVDPADTAVVEPMAFGLSPAQVEPARSAEPVREEPESLAAPRWGSITPGEGWTPTQHPAPAREAGREDEADEEDLAEAPRHPYTWLHMIVLVLVAFVLGMLIFVVLLNDSGAATQGAGAAADVVAWSRGAAGLVVGVGA